MNQMKIIITGTTGYVGEGTLLELLKIDSVEKVLAVSRKPSGIKHDVEISVIIVILIFIDEVHHLRIGSLTLLDVHLLTPIIDSIFEGSVDVITSIFKWFSAGTDSYLFREEVTFIMYIIDLTATFTDSVRDREFIPKQMVNLLE